MRAIRESLLVFAVLLALCGGARVTAAGEARSATGSLVGRQFKILKSRIKAKLDLLRLESSLNNESTRPLRMLAGGMDHKPLYPTRNREDGVWLKTWAGTSLDLASTLLSLHANARWRTTATDFNGTVLITHPGEHPVDAALRHRQAYDADQLEEAKRRGK